MNLQFPFPRALFLISLAVCGVLLLTLTACGGGGSTGTSNTPPSSNPSSAPVSIGFGDAPSDRVVSFEITINSLSLTNTSGTNVSVLSTPRKLELTHLSATTEHVAFLSVPAGTYNSATVSFSNPEVTFIGAAGVLVKKELTNSGTLTFAINPAVTISTAASVLSFDVDAGKSITVDLATNNVTVSPVFTLAASATVPSDENEVESEAGEIEHVQGQVTATSGTSFTIAVGQTGTSMTFQTNSTTQFEGGVGGVGQLTPGATIVRVEGITRTDGTLLAKEVEVESVNGAEAEGLVTKINSASQFEMVAQDGSGSGMSSALVGTTLTVNYTPNFAIASKKVSLSGLPFTPTFNSINLGQRVEADTDVAITGSTVTAKKIKLLPQAVSGTVSNSTASQFTLTLAADSALGLITNGTVSTVTVFRQSTTQLKGLTAITDGATVRARGLLFVDGGAYKLVAIRVTP